ncbi:MAG: chloride channel protein [Nitrososphaerales archaeon]
MILAAFLLAVGIYGLLTKRQLVKVLISIGIIAVAASMDFVLLASSLNRALGEAFLILAFSMDTCVAAIVLALLVIAVKKYGICDIRKLAEIERSADGEQTNLRVSSESFFEFAKYWLLPLFLGVVIGLAIFLLVNIYKLLISASFFIINWNSLFLLASTSVALLGGYITTRLFAENKEFGCGTELVIERYHFKNGFVSLRDTIGKTLASAITIGFGGSAGLEGPSLLLGGGISSFITRRLKLGQKDVKTLFLCGAAAGFSAIFKAPLTGILFALEMPYKRDVETEVFIPASIASVTAYFTSAITLGTETIFPTQIFLMPTFSILIHATFLGILAALVALAFMETLQRTNSISKWLANRFPMWLMTIFAGLILGVIGLLYPEVLGLGYDFVHKIAMTELGELTLTNLTALLILKIVATSVTLNFGGSGGLFIPSLYVGGTLGLIYAQTLNLETPVLYAILSMAAVLAATSKSLLTSITLVAETMNPSFIVPTVISAVVSYFLTGSRSLYKSQLVNKLQARHV